MAAFLLRVKRNTTNTLKNSLATAKVLDKFFTSKGFACRNQKKA